MNILHLANWNSTNIGNGALIYGTQRLLEEDLSVKPTFVAEAWDDYTFKLKKFDESFVELVNQHDMLLVNGAVTMNAYRRSMHETGMRFNLPLELWKQIEKPIVFYGISYRCWPFQEYSNKDALKRAIEYAIANERIFFGVRNDGTKEWIARTLGIESERIYEVPDPGLFVPSEDNKYPELHLTRKNVLIAFNGEDAVHRFAGPFEKAIFRHARFLTSPARLDKIVGRLGLYKKERRRIIRELAFAVEAIAQEHDAQFVLVPHYLDDYGMIQEFIEIVQERIAHQRIVTTGLVSVPHTAYFYGRYAKADLAISMRVHSMSPSIGLGIPVIPLVSQGRMRNFLTNAGLSSLSVDVATEGFGTELVRRANELIANPSKCTDATRVSVARMRAQARDINMMVERIAGSV